MIQDKQAEEETEEGATEPG